MTDLARKLWKDEIGQDIAEYCRDAGRNPRACGRHDSLSRFQRE